MSRLTRDGTAEPVSRDQILRRERGQGNGYFSCSADHEQDWQPYPVDPYSCYMCDHAYIQQLSQSRCLSLLLAMSSRVYLFFPPRGHEPPPTLRDRFNPHLSLQNRRFPIPRYAKRPDVALYAMGPLRTAPSRFPNTTRFGSRPPLIRVSAPAHKKSYINSVQRCLNALTPGYLKGTVLRGHPMIWSLALCPDDAKQDPVMYGAEFGVMLSWRRVHVLHPYRKTSVALAFTIRVLRERALLSVGRIELT